MSRKRHVSIADVFHAESPQTPVFETAKVSHHTPGLSEASPTTPRLQGLLEHLTSYSPSLTDFETGYVAKLTKSAECLQTSNVHSRNNKDSLPNRGDLLAYQKHCQQQLLAIYHGMMYAATMAPQGTGSVPSGHAGLAAARLVQQLPRFGPVLFLQQLSRDRWDELPPCWQACIVQYGLALVAAQRAGRLVAAVHDSERRSELANPGHLNWNPSEHPETLLLEAESGLILREAQEQIAGEMRAPSAGNRFLQLNMGEGKSSVILPVVATALANGSRLGRVIVAKPQSKQTAQMLIAKLGGLLDRRLYYLPFSRALKLDSAGVERIKSICLECRASGGILLVQPEHLLSLQLMVLESSMAGKPWIGRSLLGIHEEIFERHARDMIDESDEILSSRYELIYTSGLQQPLEFAPYRWLIVQRVLDALRDILPGFTSSLEIKRGSDGSFPRTRIISVDGGENLLIDVAQEICDRTSLISGQGREERSAILAYITRPVVSHEDLAIVESDSKNGLWRTDSVKQTLLLLRDLFAGGVLAFVFTLKRWRANYWLTDRLPATQLAVPYKAKDQPTGRAEFSHPDVIILLTSLSYYYGGLSDEQLRACFAHLLRADSRDQDIRYTTWVDDAPLLKTSGYATLQSVNVRDKSQCETQVFPFCRFAKAVVDYYLANIIFPREMKEFPSKPSASGWDLGRQRANPTTGFSGTSDSQITLPLSCAQLDLEQQRHTDALVLSYLLQEENGVELVPASPPDQTDASTLIQMVLSLRPSVQVLLDVGALVLELDTIGVAREWLSISSEQDVEAVVFVNSVDEISVLDRQGHVEYLRTSSYAARLDRCYCYLDESHTRGIDLKFPHHYRAAVTLGAGLVKDRLVQAAMRMRKLGCGQTVVFCVPEEIAKKIARSVGPSDGDALSTTDVLQWSIGETFADVRKVMPLWKVQAERFTRQEQLWKALNADTMSIDHAVAFLEDEAQTLEARYRPRIAPKTMRSEPQTDQHPDFARIRDRLQMFDGLRISSSVLQEEQERELAPEIEQQREVQEPPRATAARHEVHADLHAFVDTGCLRSDSSAVESAFLSLRSTSVATTRSFDQLASKCKLLVTHDFSSTVRDMRGTSKTDRFQGVVQFVLRPRKQLGKVVIISPHEANALLPQILESEHVVVSLFTPCCNRGYRSMDCLDFCNFPGQLDLPELDTDVRVELILFSGQLYMSSYEDYLAVCKYLGLATYPMAGSEKKAPDGFLLRGVRGGMGNKSGLTHSPVDFFKAVLTRIRGDSEEIEGTDVGDMLSGRLLPRSRFEARQ